MRTLVPARVSLNAVNKSRREPISASAIRPVERGVARRAEADRPQTSNSLWTPAVLEQDTVVDAQHGGIVGVSARRIADEDTLIGNRDTISYLTTEPVKFGSSGRGAAW
jgi:hypothetical protein